MSNAAEGNFSPMMKMELETPKRSEQLLNLHAVEGSEYTMNAKAVAESITDSILYDHTATQVVGAFGFPDDGKSTLKRQIARHVTRTGGRLDNFVRKIGGGVRVDVIAWRDLWEGKYTVPALAPNHADKKEKQEEIDLVNENLSDGLVKTIEKYFQYPDEVLQNNPQDRFFVEYGITAPIVHIVLFDAPPVSGTKTEKGQVGIVRAENVIRDLASHDGAFKGVRRYQFRGVGIAASPAVHTYGIETRTLTKTVKDPDEQRTVLANRGVVVHGEEQFNLAEYIREGASASETDEVENDMIDTMLYLISERQIVVPYPERVTKDRIKRNHELRYQLLAKGLLPWMFRQRLNIGTYEGTILDNNRVYRKIDVPYDLPDEHHPIREIYANKPVASYSAHPHIDMVVEDLHAKG
jgi:hypothetical protein